MDRGKIWKSILSLFAWVKKEKYLGWDPYDGLNSEFTRKLADHEMLAILALQLNLYSPINLRPLLRIKKGCANKAVAIFSRAYLNLFSVSQKDFLKEEAMQLLTKLEVNNLCENKSEFCCTSYYFLYVAPQHRLDPSVPDIICTTESIKTFVKAYETFKDDKYLMIARKACNYLMSHLYTSSNGKSYFKYTPLEQGKIVFNVSALALSAIAKLLEHDCRNELIEEGEKAVSFLISHQRVDGAWPYSLYPASRRYYWQIDYHQGFIILGLLDFIPYIKDENLKRAIYRSLVKAVDFYMYRQFDDEGRAYYRYPFKYPVDIHNQAQGIITFTKLFHATRIERFKHEAEKIAEWTINNMQDSSGYFYIHKWPFFTNKIPYMRWAQAWMMLALSELLSIMDNTFEAIENDSKALF